MVTDGLVTVQDLMVVKSVAKDAKPCPAPVESTNRIVRAPAKLVRIYLGESDKYNEECLYEAIVKKLRMLDFSGATVYRGLLGSGAKGHAHKAGRFQFSHDLPIMISVIERPEKVEELLRVVADMMQDGIIVTSDAEVHQITHELPISEGVISDDRSTG